MSKILKANSNSHTELGPLKTTGMQYMNVLKIFTWKRKSTITFQHGRNMTHHNFVLFHEMRQLNYFFNSMELNYKLLTRLTSLHAK